MCNNIRSIVLNAFPSYAHDVIDGNVADYVGVVGDRTGEGHFFVRDPSLNKYPVYVFNRLVDGKVSTVVLNQTYLRFPDGREYKDLSDEVEELWNEFLWETAHLVDYKKELSHYKYLDAIIDDFGFRVFGKPNGWHFSAGFVGAHGDKCYSYMSDAENEQIMSKYHFAMLFLLTYTNLMDRPKDESYEWVLENYERFKPLLLESERHVFGPKIQFVLM